MPKCSAQQAPGLGGAFPLTIFLVPKHPLLARAPPRGGPGVSLCSLDLARPCLMSPRPNSPCEGGSLGPSSLVRTVGPALERVVQIITCHFLQILGRGNKMHLRKAFCWLSADVSHSSPQQKTSSFLPFLQHAISRPR